MEDKEQKRIKKENQKPHPRKKSNYLFHFLFCWQIPIFVKGWKKEITEDDLYKPLKIYRTKDLGDSLEKLWSEEIHCRKNPSLWRALTRLFCREFLMWGFIYLPVEIAACILQPHFLTNLLEYYTPYQTEVTQNQAYTYAGALCVTCLVKILFTHFFFLETAVVGMKVRVACSSLIYRRSLALKKKSSETFAVGRIVNLLSNDVSRFDQAFPFLNYLWIAPIEAIAGVCYIDKTLGHAAIAGLAGILAVLALQTLLSKQTSKFRVMVATCTDHRIRLMNDVIYGIQAIKMYTWDKPFAELVKVARRLEMNKITTATHLKMFINSFMIYLSKLCVFLSVLAAVLTDQLLTSKYVFALNTIYETLKLMCIILMPFAIGYLAETMVSVERIEEFLLHDYQEPSKLPKIIGKEDTFTFSIPTKIKQNATGVHLKNISVKLNQSYQNYTLRNISMEVIPGEIVGVIGTAGCGKTTLLEAILREVEASNGQVDVEGRVSYASQEVWIYSSSIRQNILFGEDFDLKRYSKVVQVCALQHDFSLFPHSDQTLVGDRGVMLSGGQKARINLARAIYKEADIYLLDDPLSAVDAHVAGHIVKECLLSYLKEKCVILVTHQIHYLTQFDRIYLLESGEVLKCGKYEEVVGMSENISEKTTTEAIPWKQYEIQSETKERASKRVDTKIYTDYCSAAGHWLFTSVMLVLFVLSQTFVTLQDFFVSFWVNIMEEGEPQTFYTRDNCLYIYSALTVAAVLTTHLTTSLFTRYCMGASKVLHEKLLLRIIYTTMTFFNQNSCGRILNRFSKDLGVVDEILPISLTSAITVVWTLVAIIILIIIKNYWMIIPTIILIAVVALFGVVFQKTNRSVKLTEGITRSSVFAHVSTSIEGLTTIRAHKAQDLLIDEFDGHQDLHSSAFYLFTSMFAAFGFWTDVVTVLYASSVIFSFFLLGSGVYAGDVGLAISSCFSLISLIPYGMKTWSELDSHMTSVERIVEYTELDQEPDKGTVIPGNTWPTAGHLTFQNVSLQYLPNKPPVLKKLSFDVKPGEKIGVVGRTGAGKSSIISVLFRLFDFEGSVIIDGVDTKSIPLNSLRSKISIIPQEPILFLGTLRKNLDPLDEFSDLQLWETLEDLKLKPVVASLPSGLESTVYEKGANFSVGQKQLLCMVRAIVKKNKVIVLDEATANVDLRTDDLIQSAIKNKFKDCTVLTIAHRLQTIIDSDKILVMDAGMVVEFDHPFRLLQNPEGYFYGYVKSNGDAILREFTQISEANFLAKKKT